MSPSEIVRDFCAMWDSPGGVEAIRKHFRADTVWENHGLATTTGPDEAIAFFAGFAEQGVVGMRFDMLALAADGDKVLTERIDRAFNAAGEEILTIPVMGIFEIADGKIAAWRDYFDTAGFLARG